MFSPSYESSSSATCNSDQHIDNFVIFNVVDKVNQSRYRPGVAQRVPVS